MRIWFFGLVIVSLVASGWVDRVFAMEVATVKSDVSYVSKEKSRNEDLSPLQQKAVDRIFEALPIGTPLRDGGKVLRVDPVDGSIAVVNAQGLILTYDIFGSVLGGGDLDPDAEGLIGCILMAWFPGAVVGCVVGLMLISVAAS
jgi:hypothetical protein